MTPSTGEDGDRVRLLGARFACRLGVTEPERAAPQTVELDVELALPLRAAGEADDLARTVDYGAVYDAVRGAVEGRAFRLLEAVAETAAQAALAAARRPGEAGAGVRRVVVRARKFRPPVRGELAAAEVEVRRELDPGP